MLWLIPAIAAVVAGICAIVGGISVRNANRRLQLGLTRLEANRMLAFDATPVQRTLTRIGDDLGAMGPLLERASTALREIVGGIRELRLREAAMALRVAGVAIRALLALR